MRLLSQTSCKGTISDRTDSNESQLASSSSTRTAAAQASVCANVKGKSPASELTERLLAAIAQRRFNLSVLIG